MSLLDTYMYVGAVWGILYAVLGGKALWWDSDSTTPFTRFVIFPAVLLSKVVVHSMAWPLSVLKLIVCRKGDV